MSDRILGISAFYDESAAALVIDGEIVAAAQEERFSRIKHDRRFPACAIDYCLREAGITIAEIDHIIFHDKGLTSFDRLLQKYVPSMPDGLRAQLIAVPRWIKKKLHRPYHIYRAFGAKCWRPLSFADHYEAQAACAFFPSPFEEAAVLVMDDAGGRGTATIGVGRGNKIELLDSLEFPHSLSLLSKAFASFCGFEGNRGEEEFMELATHGEPAFLDLIWNKLIGLREDGSCTMNMPVFRYRAGLSKRTLAALFGGPPRQPGAPTTQREADLARSLQKVVEEVLLHIANTTRKRTGCRNLCLGGRFDLDYAAHAVLLRANIFADIWIPAPQGDASGALGAALFAQYQLLSDERRANAHDSLKGALLGPRFTNEEIHGYLRSQQIKHYYVPDEHELLENTVAALIEGKIVGWFQGRMEFASSGLGARSILADARNAKLQDRLNASGEEEASFRASALSVLVEDVPAFFDLDRESPYMSVAARVRQEIVAASSQSHEATAIDLEAKPICTPHAIRKNSGPMTRIQTVDERRNGRYYRLIREFKRQTGSGLLNHRNFNLAGEPIVGTPQDAYCCFMMSDIDVLVLENCIVYKREAQQKVTATHPELIGCRSAQA